MAVATQYRAPSFAAGCRLPPAIPFPMQWSPTYAYGHGMRTDFRMLWFWPSSPRGVLADLGKFLIGIGDLAVHIGDADYAALSIATLNASPASSQGSCWLALDNWPPAPFFCGSPIRDRAAARQHAQQAARRHQYVCIGYGAHFRVRILRVSSVSRPWKAVRFRSSVLVPAWLRISSASASSNRPEPRQFDHLFCRASPVRAQVAAGCSISAISVSIQLPLSSLVRASPKRRPSS